jgi:uncharacterized protein (TIGR02996 family)
MNEHLAVFLREIKENPTDDTPRLVLADWLQDQNQPRGELIALQVQRARLANDDPAREPMHREEMLLLQRHVYEWLGPLLEIAAGWRFRRGMVQLEMRAEKMLDAVWESPETVEALAWVDELGIYEIRKHHRVPLAQAIPLGLSRVDLGDNNLGESGLLQMLGPWMRGLTGLRLACTQLSDAGAQMLAACGELALLRELDLVGNRITDEGAKSLAASEVLANLQRLDLRNNPLNHEGIAVLEARFGPGVRMGMIVEQ